MTRRVSRNSKYNQADFEKDLDELSRLIDEQNNQQDGGRRQQRRRNDNNDNNDDDDDDDQDNQDGGRRRQQRQRNNNRNDDDEDDEDNQDGGRRRQQRQQRQRNNNRNDDDDDDNNNDEDEDNNNQNGGKKKRASKKTVKKTVKKTKKTVKRTKKHYGSGKHEKNHRTFTLVDIDGKTVKSQGVYRIKEGETPLKAAERAYSKLFKKAGEKKMSQTFKLRETSRYAGDKKVYGPYTGKSSKLKTPKKIVRGGSTITIEWEHHVELK